MLAQRVALDGLGQDHRRLSFVVDGGAVGGVDLAVVVAAALEVPDLLVAHVLDQRLGARVAPEEVLAHVAAVVGLVRLVVTVRGDVHQVHQRAVAVGVQQRVPLAAPHHLDDVPAGSAEERLQLLDDLAVAAHRAVEALQVAVDHEGQVVQALERPDVHQAAAFGFVHLAVAQKAPHVLVGGVLDAPVVQVVVEPRLVDGVERAQAHRHGGEFPEVGHQPRVRIGRQPAAGMTVLLSEAVELVGGQPAFEEGARVNPRGSVALDEYLVPAAGMRFAAEEVVETDFVERRGRGVGRNVAAHADSRALGAVHHDGGVPSDPRPEATFDVLVAGEPRFQFGRDGVDVVGRRQRRDGDPLLARPFQQPQHQVARPRRPGALQQFVEGLQPLRRLFGIDVGQIGRHTFADHPNAVGFACAAGGFGQIVARELGCQRTAPVVGGSCASGLTRLLSCRTAFCAGSRRRSLMRGSPAEHQPGAYRGGRNCHPVTSGAVLIGWRAVFAGDLPKRGALALGCIAVALMGIVGCTTVTNGTATPDTKVAPAYRQSVSASVSASSATSSVRESQRQQSLTTRAVRTSCDSLATTSKDAIDKVNALCRGVQRGPQHRPDRGPGHRVAQRQRLHRFQQLQRRAVAAAEGCIQCLCRRGPRRWPTPLARTPRRGSSTGESINSTTPRRRR